MKILVLDEEFPFPLNTGKRTRSFNLLSRVAGRHEVRYLAYGEEGTDAFRSLRDMDMHPIAVPNQIPKKSGPLFYGRLLLNLFLPEPYIVTSHYSRLFQENVNQQIAAFRPDLVLCEWTPYARYVRDVHGPRKVIVTHNVEGNIWRRYHETEKQALKRWYIEQQWRKVVRFETGAMDWVDGLTAVSEPDAAEFRRSRPRVHVEVIDNGVDLEYFKPAPAQGTCRQLVFTGSMDWRPNQDAAVYFVGEILPVLRRYEPELEVVFVGRNPPAHVQALGHEPGVEITGTVDDVRPYIRDASVYIVPLRVGGGSRLKILEAFAMGKPVVSTTVGAEGLAVNHETDILLADDPDGFVASIRRVMADPPLAVRLGSAGRRLVEARYGWDALADRLNRYLESLVSHISPRC